MLSRLACLEKKEERKKYSVYSSNGEHLSLFGLIHEADTVHFSSAAHEKILKHSSAAYCGSRRQHVGEEKGG